MRWLRSVQRWKIVALLAALPLIALVTRLRPTPSTPMIIDVHSGSPSGSRNAEDFKGPLHPIESLAATAQQQYYDKVRKQSSTLDQAVAEYRKRYRREPPPKFDKWFALSQEHEMLLVDEFDATMASMEIFWHVPAQDLRNRASFASRADGADGTCRIAITNGTLENDCWYETEMEEMINLGLQLLPDMAMAFNTFDEPRIVVPHDVLDYLTHQTVALQSSGIDKQEARPRFISVGQQAVWDYAVLSCEPHSPARNWQAVKTLDPNLSFINALLAARNLCLHPQIAERHGFFVAPESMFLTNTPFPIFSQGAPSTFQDILYPSPYFLATFDAYEVDHDIPYREKANQLYWAGATTGGRVTTSNWQHLHRHRFVALANRGNESINADEGTPTQVFLLSEDPIPADSNWQPHLTPIASLAPLFDVKFTSIVQCDGDECTDLLPSHFRVGPSEDMSMSLLSKLVIDLDGNGFSGRFHRLLRTNSCVLKQTILREWHDDWLEPWLHYVPVSMGMGEVGEIVRFLTVDQRGHKVGEMIAREGAEFAKRALRRVDLGLSLVRILMEYGRVVSDDRDGLRCEACVGL